MQRMEGYSFGASFVASSQSELEPRPILVPRKISQFLETQESAAKAAQKLSPRRHRKIHRCVSQAIKEHFGRNLVFGFMFGNVAKGSSTEASDIITTIVVTEKDALQVAAYLSWLKMYAAEMGMAYDDKYPVEIITVANLEEAIDAMDNIIIEVHGTHIDQSAFDAQVWADILAGLRRGMVGDEALLLRYTQRVGKYPQLWKAVIIHELESLSKEKVLPSARNLDLPG